MSKVMNKHLGVAAVSALLLTACGPEDENNSQAPTGHDTATENNSQTPTDLNKKDENNTPQQPERPAAPNITITSPSNGATMDGDTIEVEVTLGSGEPTRVTLEAGTHTDARDGGFADGEELNFEVPTSDDALEIVVTVEDDHGQSSTDRVIVLPVEAPEQARLVILSPTDATTEAESELIQFVVLSQDAPTATLTSPDGSAKELELTQSEPGRWLGEVEVDLAPGANTFSLELETTDGVTLTETIDIERIIDTTTPELAALVPAPGQEVETRDFTVRGALTTAGADAITVKLTDSLEVPATLTNGTRFSARLTGLTPGANDIEIAITDKAGVITTYTSTVYFGSSLAAGGSHTGAIVNGDIYAWGRNNKGQLGLGYTSSTSAADPVHPNAPTRIDSTQTFVAIAFNQNASLALTAAGAVYAWGDGDDGQLGLGDPATMEFGEDDVLTPTAIPMLEGVAVVRGYDHSMVLGKDGTVWTFGDNSAGQLGDGTTNDSDVPVQVSGLSNIIQITAGSKSSYALDADGNVWGWGRDKYANLGRGSESDDPQLTPVQISGLPPIEALATGRDHVLALDREGKVWGWGLNRSTQVGGAPLQDPVLSASLVPGLDDIRSVHANGNQSFVTREDARLYGWGQNINGTLGIPAEDDISAPSEAVFGLSHITGAAIGALHGVARNESGEVFSWGWSFEGSLGGGEGTIDRWAYRIPILVSFE